MDMNIKNVQISIDEAIESLRNKPVKSTMLERLQLIAEATTQIEDLPQPLQLAKGLQYIFERCTLPIEKHDLLLCRTPEVLPNEQEEQWLSEFYAKYRDRPRWMVDGGHITFAWDFLLEQGLGGLIWKAESELESRKTNSDRQDRIDFLEGMTGVYRAYQTYINRYAKQARSNDMTLLADTCEHIVSDPPRTFLQALQLILMIGHIYSTYCAINSTITYGRLDELLLSYYLHDLQAGVLNEEQAGALIDDFNCKNNLILGRGEHQMSGDEQSDTGWFRNPTYDTPQYVILGGYSNHHKHAENPLTKLFVNHIQPRFENPFYVFRATKEDNPQVWSIICDKLRKNCSLMVYNDETQIPAMIHSGVSESDALGYTIHGCNWPDIPGLYSVVHGLHYRLPQRIMEVLVDSDGQLVKEYNDIDEIYKAFREACFSSMQEVADSCRERIAGFSECESKILSCTDCFYRGTAKTANSFGNGATKYNVIYNAVRYPGTAADMMAAIEKLVFIDNKYSLQEIVTALNADFDGYPELLYDCLHCPKYGIDDDKADCHAVRLMDTVLTVMDDVTVKNGVRDLHSWNVTITDMDHIHHGKELMATPDGRRKGKPLSENLSPTCGASSGEMLPLLNTVSKLPFNRIHSGALNLRLRHDWIDSADGLKIFEQVIKTYFQKGGMQIQVSVVDKQELLEAQKHPEKYRDLMVRITGYSAVFVDMSKKAQAEFIRRDDLS